MSKKLRFIRNVFGMFFGDVKQRYEARYAVMSALVAKAGLRIYNRHLLWYADQDFMQTWSKFPEATPTIMDRRFVLFSAVQSVRQIPGDTAECGVFRGAGSFLILASHGEGSRKTHHVFDSFEGLSAPDVRDEPVQHPTAFLWNKHDLAVGEEVVARNLAQFSGFKLYRGWIPSRFVEVEQRKFSFVHIDVDLYQPTYDSLAFFYPRMNPGGIILCDDYGFTTCPGAKSAFDEFLADKPESVIHLTTGQGLLVKQ